MLRIFLGSSLFFTPSLLLVPLTNPSPKQPQQLTGWTVSFFMKSHLGINCFQCHGSLGTWSSCSPEVPSLRVPHLLPDVNVLVLALRLTLGSSPGETPGTAAPRVTLRPSLWSIRLRLQCWRHKGKVSKLILVNHRQMTLINWS